MKVGKVGLVVHSGREDSVTAAVEASQLLSDAGIDVRTVHDGTPPERLPDPVVAAEGFTEGLDLTISLGGDGTLLRAAHLCRGSGVPVLGINLGRLGFLAEVERDQLDRLVAAVTAGDWVIEDRGTLDVTASGPDGSELVSGWALNEISVEKTARQRVLLMDVHVGSSLFARVPADAMVVATPTGSTAYAFSAGGPILSPRVRATLVTPVAPHSVFGRTLVVAEDEVVRIEVLEDQDPAIVSCDGRPPVTVPAGGAVQVVGGGTPVRLARVDPHDFYGLVRAKFGLR